jgi:hypothetical protein
MQRKLVTVGIEGDRLITKVTSTSSAVTAMKCNWDTSCSECGPTSAISAIITNDADGATYFEALRELHKVPGDTRVAP